MILQVGMQAPDFKLIDDQGMERSLHEFKGKKIVLYFYPKDNTPGCTKEACSFRDSSTIYEEQKIVVLGINYDSPESHKKFKEKNHLPFILLSDPEATVAKAYGAYKNILNYFFPQRITFLISEQGTVVDILDNIDVGSHAQDILEKFKK